MPLFGKKEKRRTRTACESGTAGNGEGAGTAGSTSGGTANTDKGQTERSRPRLPLPNLEEIQNADWYLGLRDRMEQFLEFQHRFGFSKESVSGIYDLGQLQNLANCYTLKYKQMQSLKEGMMQSYQEMMEDPSNADKKEMGQNFYEVCSSRAETAERMFAELQNAIAVKIEAINKNTETGQENSILQRLRGMKKGSPMMQLLARVKLFKGGGSGELNAIEKAKAMIGDVAEAGIGADNLEAIKTIYEAGADVNGLRREQVEQEKSPRTSEIIKRLKTTPVASPRCRIFLTARSFPSP